MGISVSVIVTTYDRPSLATSYALPVAALSYISFVVDARVDASGRYKLLLDAYVVTDKAVLAFGKALTSPPVVMADTKWVAFTKSRTDTVTMTDVLTRTLVTIRKFYETLTLTDFKKFTVTKVLRDTTTSSELVKRTVGKVLRDGVAMNDSFDATDGSQYVFTKAVMNMAFVNEQLVKTVSRPLTDTAPVTDAQAFALTKSLYDTVSVPESLAFSTALAKTDTASVTDVSFKSFSRAPFSDLLVCSDTKSLQFSKQLTDNIGTSDAGSLRSQGYADFSYFADDYVGVSRTF